MKSSTHDAHKPTRDAGRTQAQRDPGGRFLSGASPNPGGRPRNVSSVIELARERTAEAVQTLTDVMHDPACPASARVSAATALLDRAWGRPFSAVNVAVTDKPGSFENLNLSRLSDSQLDAMIAALSGNEGQK